MNITPITSKNNTYNKPAFSGQIIPNKYLENCIQYTLKSNDPLKTKSLVMSLNTILNDGTDRAFEFDAALKTSNKGFKYAPTVKINKIKQPLRLQAMFPLQELNNKNLAEECLNSINTMIKKCEILMSKNSDITKESKTKLQFISMQNLDEIEAQNTKKELETLYKKIFKKCTNA